MSVRRKTMLGSWCVLATLAAVPLSSAEDNPAAELFERKVRPLFSENCYSCHGEEKQKGKLRLDSPAGIRAGGESGPVVVPGKPDESRMILAVSYKDEDLKMPPKTRLSEKQIADLTEWVGSPGTELEFAL